MSQHDGIISNDTGANVRSDINNALSAIFTTHSGATEPSTTYSYQLWMDTSSNVLKIRNSANSAWYTLPISPVANNTVDINGGTVDGITSLTQTNVAADATDVELKYSGSTKLATTSTGIDVTGTVTADGLSIIETSYSLIRNNDSGVSKDALVLQNYGSGTNASGQGVKLILAPTANDVTNRHAAIEAIQNGSNAIDMRFYTCFGDTPPERMRIAQNGNISFYEDTGTTAKFFWDASAERLGIGTTSPVAELHIENGDIRIEKDSRAIIGFRGHTSGSTDLVFRDANASADRMVIDSSGNLLVGTASSSSKLNVTESSTQKTAQFTNTNGSFTSDGVFIYNTRTTTNSTYNHLACTNGDFSGVFLVRDSGNVVNTNNSYGSTSDAKLKENIVDASPKLEKLNQVRVVNYSLKTNPEQKLLGVVAQELEQIFPSMVEEAPDRDAEGNDLGTTTKSVKYSVFVPMLIKAIQEQQAIIEALETRIAALEA